MTTRGWSDAYSDPALRSCFLSETIHTTTTESVPA